MKHLFEKDNFSKRGPKINSKNLIESPSILWIVEAIKKNYQQNVKGLKAVHLINSLNINSNNYLVKTSSKNFAVKILINESENSLKKIKYLSESLNSDEIPSPKVIVDDKGYAFTKIENKIIQISEFVNGRYFIGGEKDIYKASKAINSFHKATKSLSSSYFKKIPNFPNNSSEIINTILKNLKKYAKFFGNDNASLIYNNKDYLINSIVKISKLKKLTNTELPMHIDLHPHNILITENAASIIDLDSIYIANPLTSIGFSYFKLMRQDIANETHTKLSKKLFLDNVNKSNQGLSFTLSDSLLFVKKEVMRRFLFILQENIKNGSSKWNNVLKTQICGMHEIDFIFSSKNNHKYII